MLPLRACRKLPYQRALVRYYNHSIRPTYYCRKVSSTASPSKESDIRFPYPAHRNPTPHQIFHLPYNATESDIKARYFDLVRIYHPDKAGTSVAPELAHARFQAITKAYDMLRGKLPLSDPDSPAPFGFPVQDRSFQTTAAFRAAQRKRQELYSSGAADDSWKDRLILAGVIVSILLVVAQTVTTRRPALAEVYARTRNSQVYNQERRREDEKLAETAALTLIERGSGGTT